MQLFFELLYYFADFLCIALSNVIAIKKLKNNL